MSESVETNKTGSDAAKIAEKHTRKTARGRKHRQIRRFATLLVLFAMTASLAAFLIYEHYQSYPGILRRDTIRLTDKKSDSLSFTWDEVRNTEGYTVYFKEYDKYQEAALPQDNEGVRRYMDESWQETKSKDSEISFTGLKPGTTYALAVRPDGSEVEGFLTTPKTFTTKMTQEIELPHKITKLTASKPFKLDGGAKTDVKYKSSDTEVAAIDDRTGEIVIKGPGVTDITVEAAESEHYTGDSDVVELRVLESDPVPSGGAWARTIYNLSADNCEVVKVITGTDEHHVPQSFAYAGDKYIIAYGMTGQGRIVTYPVDGEGQEGKEVITPKVALTHPNGFTYAYENKTCYCVMGWSSRAITYEPETGDFGSINLSYGCSGAGYDRKEKLLYTSAVSRMVAYDISDDYSVVTTTGVVAHSGGSWATQDIGGHAGILIRCLSPASNTHGINLLDLYDMREGMYLGTISCDLSEVESAIVNDDGFLELLANNYERQDYIWRTDINIETLAEGIGYE